MSDIFDFTFIIGDRFELLTSGDEYGPSRSSEVIGIDRDTIVLEIAKSDRIGDTIILEDRICRGPGFSCDRNWLISRFDKNCAWVNGLRSLSEVFGGLMLLDRSRDPEYVVNPFPKQTKRFLELLSEKEDIDEGIGEASDELIELWNCLEYYQNFHMNE